jgi:hypothetical protein
MVKWWRWQVVSMAGITQLDWILSHPLASKIILDQGFLTSSLLLIFAYMINYNFWGAK